MPICCCEFRSEYRTHWICSLNTLGRVYLTRFVYLHGTGAPASISIRIQFSIANYHVSLTCCFMLRAMLIPPTAFFVSPVEVARSTQKPKKKTMYHGRCAVTRIDRTTNRRGARALTRLLVRRVRVPWAQTIDGRATECSVYRELLNRTLGFYSMLSGNRYL